MSPIRNIHWLLCLLVAFGCSAETEDDASDTGADSQLTGDAGEVSGDGGDIAEDGGPPEADGWVPPGPERPNPEPGVAGAGRPMRAGNFANELQPYAEWDPPIALPGLPLEIAADACEFSYLFEDGTEVLDWIDHRDSAGRTWFRQANPERENIRGTVTHFDEERPISRATVETFYRPDIKRYAYNDQGQLTDEWVDRGAAGQFRARRSYHYNDAGLLAETRLGDAIERTFTYENDRLINVQIATLAGTYERRYSYDDRGRLVRMSVPDRWGETSETRTYEGDRLTERRTHTVYSAEVDCMSVGSVDYDHEETWSMRYDDAGALVGARVASRSNPPQELQATSRGDWVDHTPINYRWRRHCSTPNVAAGLLVLQTPAQLQLAIGEQTSIVVNVTLEANPLPPALARARIFDSEGAETTHGWFGGTEVETPVVESLADGTVTVQVRAGSEIQEGHVEISVGELPPVIVRFEVVDIGERRDLTFEADLVGGATSSRAWAFLATRCAWMQLADVDVDLASETAETQRSSITVPSLVQGATYAMFVESQDADGVVVARGCSDLVNEPGRAEVYLRLVD